ncbi:tail fiber protein [Paenibacillus chibensis]|uniref:tail fiber protein n=1 Tax=Paenibacillus chibensis TaxID=59846 RepID=UPI000FDC7585|nr:tail fiber protein [Paenibacillus chibensis]MEC0370057.1 tail fiber protein [Paenibacillus chibensis]
MANTPNLKLPLVDANATADVPRDMNALAQAVDTNVKAALADVTVPDASLTKKGITMLSNATDGTREDVAATEKAVKTANDRAVTAESNSKSYADTQIAFTKVQIQQESKQDIRGLERELANLNLQLEASKRVPSGVTFGSNFADSFGMTIDTTKTVTTAALSVGAISIPVESVTGLAAGMEVTIFDDVNIERMTITSISGSTLTIPALARAYKAKASVARTSAVIDTVNKCAKFGGWSTQVNINVADSTVISGSTYTINGNGRKLVRLSNNWLVTCAYLPGSGNTSIMVSKDDGNTFTQLVVLTFGYEESYLASFGTRIFVLQINNSKTAQCASVTIDALTGAISNIRYPDSAQTEFSSGASLVINEAGTEIHAVWTSKNSSYPNSFNIRYAKGTINNLWDVTWGAAQQVTPEGVATANWNLPSVVLTADGSPQIFARFVTVNANYVRSLTLDSGSWGYRNIYTPGDYPIAYPSVAFVPKSINGLANGRIWVAWQGSDSTDSSAYNIFISYSDNGGVSWSTAQKITNGNTVSMWYPSLTVNKNNKVFIVFNVGSVGGGMKQASYDGKNWIVSDVIAGSTYPTTTSALLDFTLDFEQPPFVCKTSQKIAFYGRWVKGSETPITENDIRFKLKDTDEAVTWVQHDAGLTVSAALNGQTMDKTTAGNEDQFVKALTASGPAEIRLTMKRSSTSDNVKINKILGGVG